jgi:hypothetical protein
MDQEVLVERALVNYFISKGGSYTSQKRVNNTPGLLPYKLLASLNLQGYMEIKRMCVYGVRAIDIVPSMP